MGSVSYCIKFFLALGRQGSGARVPHSGGVRWSRERISARIRAVYFFGWPRSAGRGRALYCCGCTRANLTCMHVSTHIRKKRWETLYYTQCSPRFSSSASLCAVSIYLECSLCLVFRDCRRRLRVLDPCSTQTAKIVVSSWLCFCPCPLLPAPVPSASLAWASWPGVLGGGGWR